MTFHPIDPAILAAAQDIDPRNRDDAEYIVAHPSEFDAAMVAAANRTLDALENVR